MDDTLTYIQRQAALLLPELMEAPLTEDSLSNLNTTQKESLLLGLEKEFGISLPRQPLFVTAGELSRQLQQALILREQKLSRIFTIPNILSLFRLLLIPIYVILYLRAEADRDYLLSGIILAVSCITDLFDGFIARHFDQISRLGQMLDPFADKATQGVMLFCMASNFPAIYSLLVLFVIKESFQLIMGCWYYKKGKMLTGALPAGKVSTAVLFICMILMVIFPHLPKSSVTFMIALCAVVMAISFASYIPAYFGKNKKIRDIHP